MLETFHLTYMYIRKVNIRNLRFSSVIFYFAFPLNTQYLGKKRLSLIPLRERAFATALFLFSFFFEFNNIFFQNKAGGSLNEYASVAMVLSREQPHRDALETINFSAALK